MLKDNITTQQFLSRSSSLLSAQLLANYKQTFSTFNKSEKNNYSQHERNSEKIQEFLESFQSEYVSDIRDSGKKPQVNQLRELKIKKINRNISDQNQQVKKCISKIQNYKSEIKVKLKEQKIKNQQLQNKIKLMNKQLQRLNIEKQQSNDSREQNSAGELTKKNDIINLLENKIKDLEIQIISNKCKETSFLDKNKQLIIENQKYRQENSDLKTKLQKNNEKIKLIIEEYKKIELSFNQFKQQALLVNNNMKMQFLNFKTQIQQLLTRQDNYKFKLQAEVQLLRQTIKTLQFSIQTKKMQDNPQGKSYNQEQFKQIIKQLQVKNKQERLKQVSALNKNIQQKTNEIEKLKQLVKTSKDTIVSLSEGAKIQAKREKQIFNEAVEQNKNLRKRIQQLEKLQKSKIIF